MHLPRPAHIASLAAAARTTAGALLGAAAGTAAGLATSALLTAAALATAAPLSAQASSPIMPSAPEHVRSAAQPAQSEARHTRSETQHTRSETQHTRSETQHNRSARPAARSTLATHSYQSEAAERLRSHLDTGALQDRGGWSVLRVAKWTTAALSAGAAVYGVLNNRRADEEYEQLEGLCVEQVERCTQRLPDGAYADAEVEAQYQDVRTLDRRARTGLIAGQIGVAASVVLFVLDLSNDDGPANIPYDPRTIDIMPAHEGGVSLRVNLRMPLR